MLIPTRCRIVLSDVVTAIFGKLVIIAIGLGAYAAGYCAPRLTIAIPIKSSPLGDHCDNDILLCHNASNLTNSSSGLVSAKCSRICYSLEVKVSHAYPSLLSISNLSLADLTKGCSARENCPSPYPLSADSTFQCSGVAGLTFHLTTGLGTTSESNCRFRVSLSARQNFSL